MGNLNIGNSTPLNIAPLPRLGSLRVMLLIPLHHILLQVIWVVSDLILETLSGVHTTIM